MGGSVEMQQNGTASFFSSKLNLTLLPHKKSEKLLISLPSIHFSNAFKIRTIKIYIYEPSTSTDFFKKLIKKYIIMIKRSRLTMDFVHNDVTAGNIRACNE